MNGTIFIGELGMYRGLLSLLLCYLEEFFDDNAEEFAALIGFLWINL
jgi:hypothetical protein